MDQTNCLFSVSIKSTKKVFNNNQINPVIKMDTIFMNSENSKTSEPHVLALKLSKKLGLRRGEKSLSKYLLYIEKQTAHTIT